MLVFTVLLTDGEFTGLIRTLGMRTRECPDRRVVIRSLFSRIRRWLDSYYIVPSAAIHPT
jgi:hypothetical protein